MLCCSKQPAEIPFSICEVLPSPHFPLPFLTQQQSTLLDKGKEEISSSEQGETATEPRNENTERGSPEGLEKFYHCPGISNLEVEGVTPEKVKRVLLLVLSTKQAPLAEAFPCQYNCVHQDTCQHCKVAVERGRNTSTSVPVNIPKAGWSQKAATCIAQQQAEMGTTFVYSLMLKGIKHTRAQSQTCSINPVPKMPHNCYKGTETSQAFLQERRGHCKEGNRTAGHSK